MTVEKLIEKLQIWPPDATVIISSGDYPGEAKDVFKVTEDRFDGYYSPGFAAKRRDCVIVITGGI